VRWLVCARNAALPSPWRFEPIPSGYRVIDANGLPLAHVYGQPPNAIAISDKRLTNNEAEKIARLIARLPDLVELEKDRNKARSRRKPQSLHFKPVTVGDLLGPSRSPVAGVSSRFDGEGVCPRQFRDCVSSQLSFFRHNSQPT
jgi:hypothetical protein